MHREGVYMSTNTEKQLEQTQALNTLLIEMNKNQKSSNKLLVRTLVASAICYTIIILAMIIGFFWYESQFEASETVQTTTTMTTEGENANINTVMDGNMYNDSSVRNQN